MSPSRPASRIVAALRATWAALWIFAIPKEPWGLLRLWPTLFLAIACYLWEPSDHGERLMLLAAAWDLAMQFWLMLSAMKTSRDDLVTTVADLQDCTYIPLGWDRVLRSGDAAIVDQKSLISFLSKHGLSSFNHTKHVRFFRVCMGESGVIPGGLGVFNIPFIEAVVLVRDDPEDAAIKDRFCLYHELGHTLGDEFAVQSGLRQGVKQPLATVVLAAAAMHVTTSSVLVLCACLTGLWMVRLVFERRRKSLRVISEMQADQLAIGFLDEEEKRTVLRNLASVLPRDSDLSPLEHLARIDAARSFIETGVPLAQRDRSMSQTALLWDTELPALNLSAWMVLLASFIGAPAAQLVNGFQWLIAGAFALGVLRFARHYWKGIVLELVFIERVTWQDGKFRIRRGPSRAPAPEPAT